MINKVIGIVLTILGVLGLIFGVLGVFGSNILSLNPWAMSILGLIFFGAGIGLLKRIGN